MTTKDVVDSVTKDVVGSVAKDIVDSVLYMVASFVTCCLFTK